MFLQLKTDYRGLDRLLNSKKIDTNYQYNETVSKFSKLRQYLLSFSEISVKWKFQ